MKDNVSRMRAGGSKGQPLTAAAEVGTDVRLFGALDSDVSSST